MSNVMPLIVSPKGAPAYPILFEEDFSSLPDLISRLGLSGRNACLVADSNTAPLFAQTLLKKLSPILSKLSLFTFEAGEKSKNLETVQKLYAHLVREGFSRSDFLIALGGGVVGDLAGFAASTYMRGLPFIQVPTTLLAQSDSSVGGKTGVDFLSYKNMVGAFHQPAGVYMNLSSLQSLPAKQFSCGMAEVIKSAVLADASLFDLLKGESEEIRSLDLELLSEVIRRTCEIKAGIIERDPREKGDRALLNLGHTIGHAIEKEMNFSLLHGQCVSLGLVAASHISRRRGLLSEADEQSIKSCLAAYDLPVQLKGLDQEAVLKACEKDKKMDRGMIRFILPVCIGSALITRDVTKAELSEAIGVLAP